MIHFFSTDIHYTIKNKRILRLWIQYVALQNKKTISEISIVFTSEKEILKINKEYLSHNYVTDIITFDYSNKSSIAGDLFICVPMVKNNAIDYNTTFKSEIRRVIVHGILHLLGLKDKTKSQSENMRKWENFYLNVLKDEFKI